MARSTSKMMPILIGKDFEHIMGQVKIDEEPRSVTITIEVKGRNARHVAAFVAANEPIGVAFEALPVQPRPTPHKEK